MTTTPAQQRYARQVRYAKIGAAGQTALEQAHVAIVGVGALGSVTANHLARAGVGRLTLIDRDIVDWSNLQRQLLYDEADAAAGKPKAIAAAERLCQINSQIQLTPRVADLTARNAATLLGGAQLIIDGSDNFSVRYIVNTYSQQTGIPWIYGGAVGSTGMTMNVLPQAGACLACLFPKPPAGGSLDTCETAGVLAPIIDTIASIQTMEAIKLLTGNQEAMRQTLLQIDLWHAEWHAIQIARNPACPACGSGSTPDEAQVDQEQLAAALCGRNTVQVSPAQPMMLDLPRLAARWDTLGRIESNAYLLRLHQPDGMTFVLFPDGRALVSGTDDPRLAQRKYTELIGN